MTGHMNYLAGIYVNYAIADGRCARVFDGIDGEPDVKRVFRKLESAVAWLDAQAQELKGDAEEGDKVEVFHRYVIRDWYGELIDEWCDRFNEYTIDELHAEAVRED